MSFLRARNQDGKDLPSEWATLFKTLWSRLYDPIFQPAFVVFFFLSMLIGATGIWISIGEIWLTGRSQTPTESVWADPSVFKSVVTFFAALGSLSCIEVIVVEDTQKHLRALVCLPLVAFIVLAIVAALTEHNASGAGHPFLIAGTILAAVTWWIANWDEERYARPLSTAAIGGNLDASPAGDTEGYSV